MSVGWAGGFSCFVGITQLGSALFGTDRIPRLEKALSEAFPDRLADKALIIRRYDIFLNRGAEADSAAAAAAFGSVGIFGAGGTPGLKADHVWRRPKCGRDRMVNGWFDPADLTNNNPPLSVELDVTVFGQNYAFNTGHSPELPPERLGVDRLEQSEAFGVIIQHLMSTVEARLVEKINGSVKAPT